MVRVQYVMRKGPSETANKFIPVLGEWCYCTDTKELIKGDGVTPGGLKNQYKGGQIGMNLGDNGLWHCPPPVASHSIIANTILEPGEIVYVNDEDWCYVGDGETPGGNKAK